MVSTFLSLSARRLRRFFLEKFGPAFNSLPLVCKQLRHACMRLQALCCMIIDIRVFLLPPKEICVVLNISRNAAEAIFSRSVDHISRKGRILSVCSMFKGKRKSESRPPQKEYVSKVHLTVGSIFLGVSSPLDPSVFPTVFKLLFLYNDFIG